MATSLPNSSPHTAPSLPALPALANDSATTESSEQAHPVAPPQNPMRLLLTTLATVAMLAALFLLQGCNRGEEEAAAAPPAAVEQAPEQVQAIIVPTQAPVVFNPGQVVTAGTDLPVHAAPTASSSVMELYAGGSSFTVLEPGLDLGAYPILADGVSWVRVRAGDGLAGWVNGLGLAQ
jgi:hypothetical protein